MATTFAYEFAVTKPAIGPIAEGMLPWAFTYSKEQFIQGISVVGAVIMPHNLYLHSALVKSRAINRSKKESIVEANKYFFIESTIALICSFFINILVVVVFSKGMYNKTNIEIREQCINNNNHMPSYYMNTFPNNTDIADSDIYQAGVYLGCTFGAVALYIWAVGILAAGQSSTMTGTYSGQFVMEGFLHIHISRWKRILITRSIAIMPTIAVVIFSQGVSHITGLNDFLNCVQMLQLPFALLPVLTFCSDPRVMREFAVGAWANHFNLKLHQISEFRNTRACLSVWLLLESTTISCMTMLMTSSMTGIGGLFLAFFAIVYTLFGAYIVNVWWNVDNLLI